MSTTAVESPTRSGGLREVFNLAWPLVLTNGCWTIQIYIDRVFLAQHSQTEMAATMASVVFFWAFLNLFFHTAAYVATFVAQYSGANRPDRIGPIIGQTLHFCVFGGICFLIMVPFVPNIVALGGHDPALQAHEATFLRCLCYGGFFELIKVTTYSFFNGRGQSRVVLGISVITLAINAILAYSWILGRFGFPAWGVAGAGWATFVASFVSAVLGFSLMMRKKYRDECGMAQIWKFDLTLFRRLMRFGFPNGLYVAIETAAFAAFIIFIGRMGEAELAASTMAFALNTICFLPTLGIGQAIEVLVGRHLGENRADLAENRTWIGFAMGSAVMITFAVLFVAAPDIALAPFVTEKNSMELSMTRTLLRFIAFYSLFDAANVILAFALRGAGDTRFVTKVMSFVPWLGMVLPTWLSLKYDWGLFWAWGFATFYVCLLAFIFLARFLHGAWRSMRVIEPELIA